MGTQERVQLSKQVERFLDAIDEPLRFRNAFRAIGDNPYLNGSENYSARPGCRKYRVGRYRIIYSFDKGLGVVNILKIDHRKNAYKK